jgi:O-antigen/teichoic acid export membrane protein
MAYRQIFIYFFCYFFSAGVSFAVVSVLTHHLSTVDYGIVNLYSAFTLLITPFITGGILTTVNIEFFKKDKGAYARFLGNALMIPLISTIAFTFLFFFFDNHIASFIGVNRLYVWILPCSAFFLLLYEIVTGICRNKNQVFLYAGLSIGKVLLDSGFSLLFVLLLHQTWNGRLGGTFVGYILLMIPVLVILHRGGLLRRFSSWENVKTILLVSSPFIPEKLASFVLTSSDRYFINQYAEAGTAEVGIYSIGAQMAIIVNLSLLAMNNFFFPFIMKSVKAREETGSGNVGRAVGVYFLVSLLAIVCVLIATPLIFKWFIGPEFKDGQRYALILTLAYIPWAAYQALLPVILYYQKNKFVMYVSIIAMVTSLACNFILVPRIGAIGAAWTLFTVNTLMMCCMIFKTKAAYPFALQFSRNKAE